jgi:hypothetical protein
MTRRMDAAPLDLDTMRDTARRVLGFGESTPPLEDLETLTDILRGHVQLLVPEIRDLIGQLSKGDGPAKVAQIGVDEAWRRLHTTRGFGPDAAYRHAQKVALSVNSLCDHYENLRPAAPVRDTLTTEQPADEPRFVAATVLLPCEPCFGARIFGGRHACTGTSSMGINGLRMAPVQPEPCPCDHQPSQVRDGDEP